MRIYDLNGRDRDTVGKLSARAFVRYIGVVCMIDFQKRRNLLNRGDLARTCAKAEMKGYKLMSESQRMRAFFLLMKMANFPLLKLQKFSARRAWTMSQRTGRPPRYGKDDLRERRSFFWELPLQYWEFQCGSSAKVFYSLFSRADFCFKTLEKKYS